MTIPRRPSVTAADLRRIVEILQAELAARDATEHDLGEVPAPTRSRTWRWVGQSAALLTALATVGALYYTAEGLRQNQATTAQQNALSIQQIQLAQSGQITDRFNAAVTNLSSGSLTIRLGGIFALVRIMNDSPADQQSIVQLLASFLRDRPVQNPSPKPGTTILASDVSAAVAALADRNRSHDQAYLYLLDAGLADADIPNAHFSRTILAGADLAGANLSNADLSDSNLLQTDLTDVNAGGADFTNTVMGCAITDGAILSCTKLSNASLEDAKLVHTGLEGVDLSNADLTGADLSNANLTGANLAGAKLEGAKLNGAVFTRTIMCNGSLPADASRGYHC